MNAVAVSYFVPLPPGVEGRVADLLDKARVPHAEPDAPRAGKIHFFSAVLLPPDSLNGDATTWLSIEVTFDGLEDEAVARLCEVPEINRLQQGLAEAVKVPPEDRAHPQRWLAPHRLAFRPGLGAAQGLAFDGTPGMSVARIRDEARLADWVRKVMENAPPGAPPLMRLQQVRAEAFKDPDWKWALFAEPTQLLEPRRSVRDTAPAMALAAVRDYGWYLLPLPALVVLACVLMSPWVRLPGADWGAVDGPALLLAGTATLVAVVLLERLRLGRMGLAGLLWAALAAAGAAWWAADCCQTVPAALTDAWHGFSRLIAVAGLCSGAALVLTGLRGRRTRTAGLACLAVLAAAVWHRGWPDHLSATAAGILTVGGQFVHTVLAALLLAGMLRSTATRMTLPLRVLMLVAAAIAGTHLLLQLQALAPAMLTGLLVLVLEGVVLAVAAALGYRRLREQEEADRPVDREPNDQDLQEVLQRENQRQVVQNHLAAQSIVKPGWHRKVLLSLALWAASQIVASRSPAGFLDRIGTIHHARWVLIPKSRRLVFLSNYDGSWQSYLEDFISRLRTGLSSLWSNTEGFPRTFRLTTGGASDGSRFKRWARRQQVPSRVWRSGYPDLTTSAIRTHAAIRLGLAAAQTELAAHRWLARLGMAAGDSLAQEKIPTLVFDPLQGLRHAALLVLRFGDRQQARAFVASIEPQVAFGPRGTDTGPALVLGLSAAGLIKLDGSEAMRSVLPAAFSQGMAHPSRARMLGDFDLPDLQSQADEPSGASPVGPSMRRWGRSADPSDADDAVIVLYERTADRLTQWIGAIRFELQRHDCSLVHLQRMEPRSAAPPPGACPGPSANVLDAKDGISQPVIRGLEPSRRPENAIHVVEPGEIVLGYRDNLLRRAATPPHGGNNDLINGTFLVVRQLQFDRRAFDDFITEEASRAERQPAAAAQAVSPNCSRQALIAAKLLGRWPSGASLVRAPDADPGSQPVGNDFLYGREDPAGLRCPLGAHVRRMNPRDSFEPGSVAQLAISNRHRILRVGRRYREVNAEPSCEPSRKPSREPAEGLMFMCLNADIERQFEFLQQTWALAPGFHGLDGEVDPLLGPGGWRHGFSIPGEAGVTRLPSLPRFTQLIGGGYFLLPGKDLLRRLCQTRPTPSTPSTPPPPAAAQPRAAPPR